MDNDQDLEKFKIGIYQNKYESSELIELGLSLLESGYFQQRWDVAKLFPKLGEEIIDPLLIILENETFEIEYRWFIARILSNFNDTRIIITFTQLLQTSQEEEILDVVAEGLGKMGISAIKSLETLLQQDDYSRLLAVKALAQIRHSETIKPLLKVIDDPNPEIRAITLECLGSFHHQQLIFILINALDDPASSVRKEAVIALGIRTKLATEYNLVDHLKPLLYDLNLEICKQTVLTLGRIKTNEAIEELSIVLEKQNTPIELKKEIIKALSWTESPQALTYLKQALFSENLEICGVIIDVLGIQKNEAVRYQASQILRDFLLHNHPMSQETKIKQKMATALGDLGDEIAIKCLKKLSTDSNKSVQLHAISGLKKNE
ncbi:HEAT repeat domain-containing protein [Crocosphaera sp. Alani8]|uniref:HEAT repeat domain-containing protein n=1 Tax=Crocosphaera sp. Alani8 TaxID=3038952 RepID=UPI00313AE32C